MIFWISLIAFVALLILLIYRYRQVIIPRLPQRILALFPKLNNYMPLATFSEQLEAGLSNANFDIEANIRDGDGRAGLDEQGTQEVMEIMRRNRVSFDQARLMRHNQILARNGIDPSGKDAAGLQGGYPPVTFISGSSAV